MASTPTSASTPRVSFASLTRQNLGTVRKLNAVLFPVKYGEGYYQDILKPEAQAFCQLVYYNDIPVGNICCRIENDGSLYLMTMGVLAPYRSKELGSQALEHVITAAMESTLKLRRIYLHVQLSNQDAKRFYERHGFKEIRVQRDYYKKITPRDAWVLERVLQSDE